MKRILLGVLGLLMSACGAEGCRGGLPSGQGGPAHVEPVCDAELAYFDEQLWQPVMSVTCIGCHNASGTASHSRMVLRTAEEEGYREHNFRTVRDVARLELGGVSLLLLRPSGRHPDGHTGGGLVPEGSHDHRAFEGFVQRVKTDTCEENAPIAVDCSSVQPGKPQVRRLTHEEYTRTVQDLLGLQTPLGRDFASDTVVNGFTNNAAVLQVSPLLVDQYRQAAEDLAERAVAERLPSLLPCDAAQGLACAAQFIREFGERAFRRPLSATEQGRYQAIFQGGLAQGGFTTGVEWTITAFLQSPNFLYRSELGTPGDDGSQHLTPWEIASELSYLLTGSMPDAPLMAAARAGELATPTQIEAQATRLMQSPQAREVVARFADAWLHTNRLEAVPKDNASYPEFSSEIRAAMREELARFVAHVVFDGDGTLTELLTAPYSFLDERLAQFYGVSLPAGQVGFGLVPNDGNARRGVLTTGAVLSVHAKPNSSSPVYRGKVVRERLFCQELAPPPPGIVAEPPPLDPSLTSRERYLAHSTVQPCQACHRLMDPIGFGFDRFDGVGRFRADENGHAIDDSGEIVGTPRSNGTFQGTGELADVLAQSEDVQDCFALQWFRYGYGISETTETQCVLEGLRGGFRENLSVRELMLSLTRSPHFTTRTTSGGTVTDGGMPQSEPDAGVMPPPPPSNVTVERNVDSNWASGWCERVVISNTTGEPIQWEVDLEIDGYVDQHWNSEREGDTGLVRFRGAQWNASVAPGESTDFGFCARRGGPPPVMDAGVVMMPDAGVPDASTPDASSSGQQNGLNVTTTVGTDWGAGYCMDVVVQNPAASAVEWSVTLDIDGTIYNSWECAHATNSGMVTFTGPAGRTSLGAGRDFQFGFCANR